MPVPPLIEKIYLALADAAFARWPARPPSERRLGSCRLIAHRGEHGINGVPENTLAAFEGAAAAGVWGIECDVRWTADGKPVVVHDADLKRLYGDPRPIAHFSLDDLQKHYAAIPSLATLVSRFGRRLHLMIELKKTREGIPMQRYQGLHEVLAPLEPIKDYHLMSLHPDVLTPMRAIPSKALIAIADRLPGRLSRWVLQNGWGGICGHYLLMPTRLVARHRRHGQWTGTGYAASRNVLFREINRGIRWIFSNRAGAMQRIVDSTRQSAGRQ
jgi:glycerophosphoryl diester phosphodiesterase